MPGQAREIGNEVGVGELGSARGRRQDARESRFERPQIDAVGFAPQSIEGEPFAPAEPVTPRPTANHHVEDAQRTGIG